MITEINENGHTKFRFTSIIKSAKIKILQHLIIVYYRKKDKQCINYSPLKPVIRPLARLAALEGLITMTGKEAIIPAVFS